MDKIIVYTDGASRGNGSNDSKCGWGVLLSYKGVERKKSGKNYGKTNNYMEMWAVLEALKSITDKKIPVELFSDSQYVIKTLNGEFSIGTNEELWEELFCEKQKFANITFTWVKGHNGNRGNEIANKLAEMEANNV